MTAGRWTAVGVSLLVLAGGGFFGLNTIRNRRPGRVFAATCASCHGADGSGTERGPSIFEFVTANSDATLAELIHKGRGGMPPQIQLSDSQVTSMVGYLRTLRLSPDKIGTRMATVKLSNGETLSGLIQSESNYDLHIMADDGVSHFLERTDAGLRERIVEPKQDWPYYDGNYSGNRYSAMTQINTANISKLGPAWFYPVPGAPRMQATPLVIDGVMYTTAVNEVHALDAYSGRPMWEYREPRTPGLLGEAGGGANRGVAIWSDSVFIQTDGAHLVSLDRWTGKKQWDVVMEHREDQQYASTGAPLVVGDLVIAGSSGGDEGIRGFLDAYDAATGKRAWRFWTIPKRGEKLAETWVGTALEHGCGATWLTGSYDPELDLLYWAVGNPCPDYNGDQRGGDNLYTSSILALKPKTGELKWYYQTTPHDTHDYDANQPLLLVDEAWQGKPRKLLVHANRNGYLFVLDRTNGELLLAQPFLKKVNWTKGYGKDGRPIVDKSMEASEQGVNVCPNSSGGTNWMSATYNPGFKLFVLQANETCATFKKANDSFEVGKRYFSGTNTSLPGIQQFFRAVDIQTGKTVWEYEILGKRNTSGALSTAAGIVFFGDSGGEFTAVDGKTGKRIWHFNVGQTWRASPMTYMVRGKQFIGMSGGSGMFAFALPDSDVPTK